MITKTRVRRSLTVISFVGLALSAMGQNPRQLPPVAGQSADPNASSMWRYQSGQQHKPSQRSESVAPGSYHDWHDIDEVFILQPFAGSQYDTIAVENFDTSRVQLPPADDNTFRAVQQALRDMKPAFIDRLTKNARRRRASRRQSGRTLLIRARLTKVDPGSQAARYWAGFGAGAVKIQIAGEVVDASSGQTLVRFVQERRSGFGAFGGGYGDLFRRTARQLGGDVATLINAFTG